VLGWGDFPPIREFYLYTEIPSGSVGSPAVVVYGNSGVSDEGAEFLDSDEFAVVYGAGINFEFASTLGSPINWTTDKYIHYRVGRQDLDEISYSYSIDIGHAGTPLMGWRRLVGASKMREIDRSFTGTTYHQYPIIWGDEGPGSRNWIDGSLGTPTVKIELIADAGIFTYTAGKPYFWMRGGVYKIPTYPNLTM